MAPCGQAQGKRKHTKVKKQTQQKHEFEKAANGKRTRTTPASTRDEATTPAPGNRWAARKGGSFVARDALSYEQQQILAAVPRWKKEWVRPTSLKPGQNPNFKVLKWVIDTSLEKSEGTAEEMQAALNEVAAGNVPNIDGSVTLPPAAQASASTAGSTPAPPSVPAAAGTTPAPSALPAAALSASSDPLAHVLHANPSKPAEGVAPGGQELGVDAAVKPLQGVASEGLVDTGGEVARNEKSLME